MQADTEGAAAREPTIDARDGKAPAFSSAGAELIDLAGLIENNAAPADRADRLREIAGWISDGRPSDFERGAMRLMAAMVAAMRSRGQTFTEDRPIIDQFVDLLDATHGPADPAIDDATSDGSRGIMDEAQGIDAIVRMTSVHRWSGQDGVPRAVCGASSLTMEDGDLKGLVHAEGFAADLMRSHSTASLRLRPSGDGWLVVGRSLSDASTCGTPRRSILPAWLGRTPNGPRTMKQT
jgi:hypothetical protein